MDIGFTEISIFLMATAMFGLMIYAYYKVLTSKDENYRVHTDDTSTLPPAPAVRPSKKQKHKPQRRLA
jgi:hypothetical protein